MDDLIHIGLGQNKQIGRANAQSAGAQFDLPQRFLARHIQHFGRATHFLTHLQEQGGFADTRLTANQDKRTVHRAAAQHTVQLSDARLEAGFGRRVDIRQQGRLILSRPSVVGCQYAAGGGLRLDFIFTQCIPCTTRRALTVPLGTLIAAIAAQKNGLLFHVLPPTWGVMPANILPRYRSQAASGIRPRTAFPLPRDWTENHTRQ